MDTYEKFLEEMEYFIFPEDEPGKADIIFIPGNGYPQMAERAAELYKAGAAPVLLPSGKYSITAGHFTGVLEKRERYRGAYKTECAFLKDVLIQNGVPQEAVLMEEQATYTYENAKFSRQVTDQAGLLIKKAILCCKSYHARRCLMYYQHVYPETEFLVIPSVVDGISRENWKETQAGTDAVLGEVTRIIRQFTFMM